LDKMSARHDFEASFDYFIGPESFFGYNNTECKLMLEWILRTKKAHFETLLLNLLARRFLKF
jgi:hypothetical protein